MKKRIIRQLIILCLLPAPARAQINPPGLGRTHTSAWLAFAVQQDLDTISGRGWKSVTYFGIGRKSNPDSHNPVENPGIIILNQEFKNHFHRNWEYSLALSYRHQDEYKSSPPYEHDEPRFKQELRIYSRFSYLYNGSFMNITPTIRQEFRKFFNPDFTNYSENIQLRTRFRIKFDFPLTGDGRHHLLLFSEQLFSTSQELPSKKWSAYKYTDSRFAVYYSLSPKNTSLTFNFGYMNNLAGTVSPYSGNYFAMDITWKNPLQLIR